MNDQQQQTVLDCKNTFSTICGERFLEHLKRFCGGHVNQENFDAASATQTAYNLGRNRVYRYIQSMMECDLGTLNHGQDCLIDTDNETGE